MSEAKTFTGGCHCGRFRYEATTDLARVVECNCSICSKRGHLLTFVPASQVEWIAGSVAEAGDYQFGKKRLHHHFCQTCGVNAFSSGKGPDGAEMIALNVRCLEGVDLATLTVTKYDGAKI